MNNEKINIILKNIISQTNNEIIQLKQMTKNIFIFSIIEFILILILIVYLK